MRRIETHDWWPELVALKDELSLRELASRFGVTPGAVSAALKRAGLERRAAPPGPRGRRKAKAEEAPRPGSKDALLVPYASELGLVPDAEIARRAGVSVRTVASYRARNEIPGFAGPREGRVRGRGSRIDPFREMVGRVPDRVVAERAGVSLNAVRNYRIKHAISAAGPQPAADGDTGAWRVLLVEDGTAHDQVVLALDLLEAARKALAAYPNGQLLEVVWVGPVL